LVKIEVPYTTVIELTQVTAMVTRGKADVAPIISDATIVGIDQKAGLQTGGKFEFIVELSTEKFAADENFVWIKFGGTGLTTATDYKDEELIPEPFDQLPIPLGNVSGTGTLNAGDASYILQYLVGGLNGGFPAEAAYPGIDIVKAANVSGTGTINAGDASYILQRLVGGLQDGFPCEQ